MRCVHEAQLHTHNCFITLTYDNDSLPKWGSLQKPDLQRFFKRLRKRFYGTKFLYYACGEYGDNTNRAHYHACLFGLDFNDKIPFRRIGDHTLYLSATLSETWGLGNTSVGSMTFETAAYTARYVTKKLNGPGKYVHVDELTGEIYNLQPPFAVMSLKPAIAKNWIAQYHGDIYNAEKDYLYMRGKRMKPTKYYDKQYDTINPEKLETIKQNRLAEHETLTHNEQRARETITRARLISRKQI